ncbi:hypothetical protein RSAG8_02918, partial [Rhizoctonia solani AG-8 WAC10335]
MWYDRFSRSARLSLMKGIKGAQGHLPPAPSKYHFLSA